MRTNIYFVRHAHSEYTPDELGRPLSKRGSQDAERVTELLKQENISMVLSSPYKRAIETVAGIAEALGTEVIPIEGFRERLLTDQPVADFSAAIKKVWEDDTFSLEGGESNKDAQKRGVDALMHVLDTYCGENIAVGTHGNIMVLIMKYFNNDYGFEFWNNLDMPDIYKLTFDGLELAGVQRLWNKS
ncbi:histidine phosphatase family protein [Neobacillus sp. YIM B06451]|uniref:histidine phosphatase family protein n=1 Tax=Neobacillus sp. YIM B06451 TaxID=3070994 RepID=UPI00292D4E5D|nr:histidine phosphatase family protein [Neobacillus sp. YIM B06451]